MILHQQEPICALATPPGVGALAVIRVSGDNSLQLVNTFFKGKNLTRQASHTAHFGLLTANGDIIDEVVATVFRSPHSFTKEDTVEISCHGSGFVISKILQLLIQKGARLALPGEFTQRAFLNGRFDLVQAEAVADLIASDSEVSHRTAMNQLRGGFSEALRNLRQELIHFASLVELELDFSEEDVEFAGRDALREFVVKVRKTIKPLTDSFALGNSLKEGIKVAIVGAPNVGKSTLLNALLREERAIVTPVPGTTRDIIEETNVIDGIKFRFLDTAGIRHTEDEVETLGIERSRAAIRAADVVLLLYDGEETLAAAHEIIWEIAKQKHFIWVQNKSDLLTNNDPKRRSVSGSGDQTHLLLSAQSGTGLDALRHQLFSLVKDKIHYDTLVTSARHYQHLLRTDTALGEVLAGLDNGITGDFLAQDIRLALHHLGEITGEISSEDLLARIFSEFCIGK